MTFLGGEPFEQAIQLSEIAQRAKSLGLSVITFTGYTMEELKKTWKPGASSLLEYTDLLIDGPYKEELRDFSRPWVGSLNQRYIFLSKRYSKEQTENERNHMEIRIDKGGNITINGMADFPTIIKTI